MLPGQKLGKQETESAELLTAFGFDLIRLNVSPSEVEALGASAGPGIAKRCPVVVNNTSHMNLDFRVPTFFTENPIAARSTPAPSKLV